MRNLKEYWLFVLKKHTPKNDKAILTRCLIEPGLTHKSLDRLKYYKTDFCISQFLLGFWVLDSLNTGLSITFLTKAPGFQRCFTENTLPSCKKANTLGWHEFYNFLRCHFADSMSWNLKCNTASSVVFNCLHKLHYWSAKDLRSLECGY